MGTVVVRGQSGKEYQFVDSMIGAGGMKDVYFSPDRSYVVAFFRDKVDAVAKQRLEKITDSYRKGIFDAPNGDYWRERFCWPYDVVEHDGRVGVVAPTYPQRFFFSHGSAHNDALSIKGREKEGKWFACAKLRPRLDPRELGTWREALRQSLNVARAVNRMHAAGLAHSDLSYKNVLVDPSSGEACLIDIDGLVVPGIFPPEVVGTPDFIAPEVLKTADLPNNGGRILPSAHTDRHALAVLIYMYLFLRHPLRGGKIHSQDPAKDEDMMMGSDALFIEHPTNSGNRVNPKWLADSESFWGDPAKIPYTAAGPYLKTLFDRAFVDGLHNPQARPIAMEWETALLSTLNMIQPCSNNTCDIKWYVFDNSVKPRCPACKTAYQGSLPVLDLYVGHGGTFRPANQRIMVWDGQSLFPYHVHTNISPGPGLQPQNQRRVGYFQKHQGAWYLINEGMDTLTNVTDTANKQLIRVGEKVELTAGMVLQLSTADTGRLVSVSLANV